MPPSLVAIVPTLNEAGQVGAVVAALRDSCDEVVVVDAGSADGTVDIARAAGARVCTAPPGRGVQLGAGVAASRSDLVWFVHADTLVPAGAGHALRALSTSARWGCCTVRFDLDTPWMRFTAAWMNARARRTGKSTGDMAQWFHRDLLHELGGVPPLGAFEDLVLSDRARAVAPWAVAPVAVTTSARRWRVEGRTRTTLRHWTLRAAYEAGVPPETLAQRYRSQARRPTAG